MAGYLLSTPTAAPELTADGWLRTGDLGRFDKTNRRPVP